MTFEILSMKLTNNGVAVYYRMQDDRRTFRAELTDGWEEIAKPEFVEAVNASGLIATEWDR